MSRPLDHEYTSRPAHRYHMRRRALKKVALLTSILGLMCLFISVLVFGGSFVARGPKHHNLLVMSAVYAGAGLVLLLVRWVIALTEDKPKTYHPRVVPSDFKPDEADEKGGMVLVLVLVVLGLVAALVVEAQLTARMTLRRSQAVLDTARLREAAGAAAWKTLQRLADDETLRLDTLDEAWNQSPEIAGPDGVMTRVRVTDANSRIDLNNLAVAAAPGSRAARSAADVVMDVMTVCGDFSPVQRVDALTDWVDADGTGSAEEDAYRDLRPPSHVPNRPLHGLSETLLVRSFDRAYFKRHEKTSSTDLYAADLVDCVAAVPGAHTEVLPVNLNTASRDVLLAVLGMDQEALVRMIVEGRRTQPILSPDPVLKAVSRDLAAALEPWLDVKSTVFCLDVKAYTKEQAQSLWVLAKRATDGSMNVLQWVLQ